MKKLVDAHFRDLPLSDIIKTEIAHAPEELSAEVDPDQITQVLSNLVSNAVEAMPSGGLLKVRTFRRGAAVCFSVSDSGTGITEENIKKIFEPFFTTKQIGKGTGLGLAVSYGIIKVHSGNISVQSNADQSGGPTGSVFTVTIPAQSGTAVRAIENKHANL